MLIVKWGLERHFHEISENTPVFDLQTDFYKRGRYSKYLDIESLKGNLEYFVTKLDVFFWCPIWKLKPLPYSRSCSSIQLSNSALQRSAERLTAAMLEF